MVVSRLSMYFLDECILTTLVRPLYVRAGATPSGEWFTVRAAHWVFGMVPSRRAVSIVSEMLILLTAVGVVLSARGIAA